IPVGTNAHSVGHSPITQFLINIGILADAEHKQAVILSSMLFILVIWVISALSMIIAAILCLLFLWHHIPSSDTGLTGYCERKINNRLNKIVDMKTTKALEAEASQLRKEEAKALREGGDKRTLLRVPTLPILDDT